MSNQHIGLSEGLRGYGDNLFPYHYYTVGQALGSIVISTIVLLAPDAAHPAPLAVRTARLRSRTWSSGC